MSMHSLLPRLSGVTTPVSARRTDDRSPTPSQHPAAVKPILKLKALVVGSVGTGKTSIVNRYTEQYFSSNYRPTLGADFATKYLNWDGRTTIQLDLWDIAGQERLGCLSRAYYREAMGCLIVFDLTRSHTFDDVLRWKVDIDSCVRLNGNRLPCVLLANKCDLKTEELQLLEPVQMDVYCKDNGFAAWFETSAKMAINIDDAVRRLVVEILDVLRGVAPPPERRRALSPRAGGDEGFERRSACDC